MIERLPHHDAIAGRALTHDARVLLVEDSRTQQRLIQRRLQEGEYGVCEVQGAASLAEAFHCLANADFDVVLLDLELPDCQGLTSVQQLCRNHSGTPVVVITATDNDHLAAEAIRHGAQDYLHKDRLDTDAVEHAIRFAIERNRRVQAERHVLRAQREERRRLAGELHDGVIQTLSNMRLQLQMLHARVEPGEPHRETVREIADEALAAIAEVRRVSHDLHPSLLERRDLPDAIAKFVADLRLQFGHECEIVNLGCPQVGPHSKEHVYRMIQECLRNVIKHAQARRTQIILFGDSESLTVEVRDDGVGFDPQAGVPGLGLTSIRERARMLGGQARIASRPGNGTIIRMDVPT